MRNIITVLRSVLGAACAAALLLGASSAAYAERYAYFLVTNEEGVDLLYSVRPLGGCYEGERHMADGSWANTGEAFWDIIPAGETVRIRVWRRQLGHCDGEQSEFLISVAHRYTALHAHSVTYRQQYDQSLEVRTIMRGEPDRATRGLHVTDGRAHSNYIYTDTAQPMCGARFMSMDNSGAFDREWSSCENDVDHLGHNVGYEICQRGSSLDYGREEPVESVRWRINHCELSRR